MAGSHPPAPVRGFALFGLIGLFNTALHSLIVILLAENGWAPPVAANVAAFFCANGFSYWANSRFNFRIPASWRRYLSFLTVSLSGLALTIVLAATAESLGWHYLAGLGLVVTVTPVATYLLLRKFTFRRAPCRRSLTSTAGTAPPPRTAPR